MYKDKGKQREAQRKWVRQKRAEAKGSTDQIWVVSGKCWCCGNVIPTGTVCCGPCAWSGKAETERVGRKPPRLKQGADIKTFEDLPPDVQRTINILSTDAEDKARRTARAIHYQHLFPDRYYSTGFSPTTPQDALIKHVADNGGEVSFKTVKGKVQDVHYTPQDASVQPMSSVEV